MFYQCLVVIIGLIQCDCFEIQSTTKTYDLEIPGSASSIRIIESDTPWSNDQKEASNRYDDGYKDEINEDKFSPQALEKFLSTYADKLRKKQDSNLHKKNKYDNSVIQPEEQESTSVLNDKENKSKWNLMYVQKNKHPFDDNNGWVSLDPVPWSLSKISKWHSDKKPVKKPQGFYESGEIDMETSEYDEVPTKPTWYQKPKPYKIKPLTQFKPYKYKPYEEEEEESNEHDNYYESSRPTIIVQKPESLYGHKIHVQYDTGNSEFGDTKNKHYIKRPGQFSNKYHGSHGNCEHLSEEIITDGQPSNFPNFPHNRRKSTDFPVDHPFTGNGDWVLLSTTKGFKSPQNRRRSLQFPPTPSQSNQNSDLIPAKFNQPQTQLNPVKITSDSIGFKKGIQLTVLPPLKNSKINMTTSHGGLLQVESTFETVEQAQQRHAKKLKDNIKRKPSKIRVLRNKNVRRKPITQRLNVALPISAVSKKLSSPDISTVLAAAGAGMIPATMAMLVPMAMGGKRRRRRNVHYPHLGT